MISQEFADALANARSRFNQRTRDAVRRYPAFRTDVFRRFLEDCIDPVVAGVASCSPERLPAVVHVAYDIALELSGRAQIGTTARSPVLADAWTGLFPRFSGLIAAQPGPVLSALSNAVLYLDATVGVRTNQWLDEMAALASQIKSVEELRSVGQVVAWRAGAAHFRPVAIAAATTLPEPLALAALGCPTTVSWPQLRAQIERDPWTVPSGHYTATERAIGSFAGFGGPFAAPPEVRYGLRGFVVRSGEHYFLLIADAYGAVLLPASAEEFESTSADVGRCDFNVAGEELLIGSQRMMLDVPSADLSVCATGHTIVITSPYTHVIRVARLSDRP